MALPFPLTTQTRDTFTRADENPMVTASDGEGWLQTPDHATFTITPLKVLSNQCAGTGGNGSHMYVNTIDADYCEAYATVATVGATGDTLDLAIRVRQLTSFVTMDGYYLRYTVVAGAANDTLVLTRFDNASPTNLATFTQEISAGDSIGLRMIGSTLEAFYKASAGSWASLGTATDSTYTAGANAAMTIAGTTMRVTQYGGGSVINLLPMMGVG